MLKRLFDRHNRRGDGAGIGNQISNCRGIGEPGYIEREIHRGRSQGRCRANGDTVIRIAIAIQTLQQARNIQHHRRAGVEVLRHIQRGHYALRQHRRKLQGADKKSHRLTGQIVEFTSGISETRLGRGAIANARNKRIHQHTDNRGGIGCISKTTGRLC